MKSNLYMNYQTSHHPLTIRNFVQNYNFQSKSVNLNCGSIINTNKIFFHYKFRSYFIMKTREKKDIFDLFDQTDASTSHFIPRV